MVGLYPRLLGPGIACVKVGTEKAKFPRKDHICLIVQAERKKLKCSSIHQALAVLTLSHAPHLNENTF